MPEKQKRSNINFRQTPKELRSAKQAATYEHLKRNMPYNVLGRTQDHFGNAIAVLRGGIKRLFRKHLPQDAKKVR